MRINTVIKTIIWNVFFIFVAVIVVELIFGNWFSSKDLTTLNILRDRTWHYDFYYPGIPNQERKITYSRDYWGLRGDFTDPVNIDLLTVGGSTTDQRFISDGFTWQDVLQRKFNETGQHVKIANAGVDGRTTFGHQHDFNYWFAQIEELQPRFIMLYVGINDMFFSRQNSSKDSLYLAQNTWQEKVKLNSAVYAFARSVLGSYIVIKRDIGHTTIDYSNAQWTSVALQSDYSARLAKRLAGYSKRFNLLLQKIEKMGATPIVVSQPRGDARVINGQLHGLVSVSPRSGKSFIDSDLGELGADTANGMDYHHILSLFNAISLERCEQHSGICIDLANQLEFADGDFYDQAHNTRQGAKKIGEFLYAELRGRINEGNDF